MNGMTETAAHAAGDKMRVDDVRPAWLRHQRAMSKAFSHLIQNHVAVTDLIERDLMRKFLYPTEITFLTLMEIKLSAVMPDLELRD